VKEECGHVDACDMPTCLAKGLAGLLRLVLKNITMAGFIGLVYVIAETQL